MSESDYSGDVETTFQATPAILRTLHPERDDDVGAYTEEDIARGRAGAQLALSMQTEDDDVSDDATDCDTKRVSFHERLEQVRMISPRGRHLLPSSDDDSVSSETKPSPKASRKRHSFKPPQVKSTSAQKLKQTTSPRRVKSATERTPVKNVTSSSSSAQLLKKFRRARSATLQQKKHALRHSFSTASTSDVSEDQDFNPSTFLVLNLNKDENEATEQLETAKRVYAWHLANGTAPPENMAPSVASVWDHQQTRVSQLFI